MSLNIYFNFLWSPWFELILEELVHYRSKQKFKFSSNLILLCLLMGYLRHHYKVEKRSETELVEMLIQSDVKDKPVVVCWCQCWRFQSRQGNCISVFCQCERIELKAASNMLWWSLKKQKIKLTFLSIKTKCSLLLLLKDN